MSFSLIMKKFLIILSIFLVLALIVVGLMTVVGKMPGLSSMVYEQVDLGVQESPDIIYDYYEEIGYVNNLKGGEPKRGELVFDGGIDVEHTFTQQEINSWIAAWESEWEGLPFQNSQIRINPDGSVEATSMISVSNAESFAKSLGYTDEDINKAKSYVKVIPDPLPVYAKGTASIESNNVTIDVQSFKVGGYTLPSNISSAIGSVLESVITSARQLNAETDVERAVVTADGVDFKGTVPASVDVR